MPILIGFTMMLNTFFIIYKGGKGIGLDDLSAIKSLMIALSIGVFSGLGLIPFIPRMKAKVNFGKCPELNGARVIISWSTNHLTSI